MNNTWKAYYQYECGDFMAKNPTISTNDINIHLSVECHLKSCIFADAAGLFSTGVISPCVIFLSSKYSLRAIFHCSNGGYQKILMNAVTIRSKPKAFLHMDADTFFVSCETFRRKTCTISG